MGTVREGVMGTPFEREEVTGTDIKFFNKETRICGPTRLHVLWGY